MAFRVKEGNVLAGNVFLSPNATKESVVFTECAPMIIPCATEEDVLKGNASETFLVSKGAAKKTNKKQQQQQQQQQPHKGTWFCNPMGSLVRETIPLTLAKQGNAFPFPYVLENVAKQSERQMKANAVIKETGNALTGYALPIRRNALMGLAVMKSIPFYDQRGSLVLAILVLRQWSAQERLPFAPFH
jgi:hypothetical protein